MKVKAKQGSQPWFMAVWWPLVLGVVAVVLTMTAPMVVKAAAANTDSASALILSPQANANVHMQVAGGQYQTLDGTAAGNATQPGSDLATWTAWRDSTKTYMNFVAGAKMHGVGLTGVPKQPGQDSRSSHLSPYQITLDYDAVGYYNFATNGRPDLQKVGANPSWAGATTPYIIFSDNLYSGVVYGAVKSMHITLQFYRSRDAAKTPINFANSRAVFTFNSLNPGQSQWQPENSVEFAGSGLANGTLTPQTYLRYSANGISGAPYTARTYYGTSNAHFDDWLGSDTLPNAAVTFPLSGLSNSFVFGSVWGRAWNAFSSSANYPTGQSAPSKTVMPLQQYQPGDTWDHPTGAPTGFAQRYDNDLDRYDDGGGAWSYLHPQPGHDPDHGDLLPGIPAKADRFVQSGQAYYYDINQPTIDLRTQGLILPDGYAINDDLPAGTQAQAVTLYNLDGSVINDAFQNAPQLPTRHLALRLSDHATAAINALSKQAAYYGRDFTVRVKFQVTNTTDDQLNDLMVNQASSQFFYRSLTAPYTAESNLVHIRVKDAQQQLPFQKVAPDGHPLAGAVFELQDLKGNSVSIAPVTSGTDGKFTLQVKHLADGTYVLHEISAPAGYAKRDYHVAIKAGQVVGGEVTLTAAVAQVVDQPQTAKLVVHKRATLSAAPLADAAFTIYEAAGDQLGPAVKTVTTAANGQAVIEGLAWAKTYWAVETKAPVGYRLPDPTDPNNWQKITFSSTQLVAETTFKDALQPLTIRLNKVASGTGEQLPGATFELTGSDGFHQKKASAANIDHAWNLQFSGLLPGHTYALQEITAPAGYVVDPKPHTVVVAKDGMHVTIDDKQLPVSLHESANIAGSYVIENHLKPLLPHTGGPGVLATSLAAIGLFAMAAGLALAKRRHKQPKI
ncbi:SpaA isopeptide-forming pilin-related protein [Lacticaseibacillus jixiensis]|uniref:SpaA isopeptide-forming pilin-related protein n=1 Tax=Lacticaseibacillus jixiensis TaxID=3231926 RepID=UPI0036F44E13